jgi:uncharacterized membrane protein (DUF485 family)
MEQREGGNTVTEEPAESRSPETGGTPRGEVSRPYEVDWAEATHEPSFRALMLSKRRFLVPVLILSLGFFLGTMILAGFAPGFTARGIIGPISVGYLLVFATYIITWGVALLYVRVANRDFDPKAADALSELQELRERQERQEQGEDNA